MHLIKSLIRKNVWLYTSGAILMIVSGAANITILKFIGDNIASQGAQLLEAPYLFFGLVALAFILPVSTQWILQGVAQKIVYQLREQILTQLLQTEPEQMEVLGRSKIYNAFSTDIPNILNGVMTIPYSLFACTLILGGLGYLFTLSPSLALLAMSILGSCMFISRQVVIYSQKMYKRNREINNSLLNSYGNIVDGHKELVLNEGRGKAIVNDVLNGDALESKDILTRAGRAIAFNNMFLATVPLAIIGIVFWAIYQWQWASPETGVSFAIILMFIRQPIGNILTVIPQILQAAISLKHLKDLELPTVQKLDTAEPLSTQWKQLSVADLQYSYPGNNDFKLGPIDLTIERGELLFLVGKNGAGKSTLVKLLSGLKIPTHGSIAIDKEVIGSDNRRQYRAMFSAVLSDFFLFDQVLGIDEGTFQDADANELVKQLQLQNVVSIKNGVFSSTKLSTGQRKRLAMIVASLEKSSVIVLDEWAADQDPVFRKRFYEQILPKLKAQGITLIVVSHDDRYFHVADRLISIDSGKAFNSEELESILA